MNMQMIKDLCDLGIIETDGQDFEELTSVEIRQLEKDFVKKICETYPEFAKEYTR